MTDTLHGITTGTPQHMLVDAGVLVRNYVHDTDLSECDIMGATTGGIKVSIVGNIYTPKLDGALGPVRETERIIAWDTSMSGEWSAPDRDNITDIIPGAVVTSEDEDHWLISPGSVGPADYLTNVALLVTHSSDPTLPAGAVFLLKNPRGTGKLAFDTKAGENATLPFEFEGTVSAAAPQTAPWEIYYPKVSGDVS